MFMLMSREASLEVPAVPALAVAAVVVEVEFLMQVRY